MTCPPNIGPVRKLGFGWAGKGDSDGRKRFTAEQITAKLREAEVEVIRGQVVTGMCWLCQWSISQCQFSSTLLGIGEAPLKRNSKVSLPLRESYSADSISR